MKNMENGIGKAVYESHIQLGSQLRPERAQNGVWMYERRGSGSTDSSMVPSIPVKQVTSGNTSIALSKVWR